MIRILFLGNFLFRSLYMQFVLNRRKNVRLMNFFQDNLYWCLINFDIRQCMIFASSELTDMRESTSICVIFLEGNINQTNLLYGDDDLLKQKIFFIIRIYLNKSIPPLFLILIHFLFLDLYAVRNVRSEKSFLEQTRVSTL